MEEPERGAPRGVRNSQGPGNKLLLESTKRHEKKRGWNATMLFLAVISSVCVSIPRLLSLPLGRRISSPEESTSTSFGESPSGWRGAGGEFGLQSDWRQALLESDGHGRLSLKGEACLSEERQRDVRVILQRRDQAGRKKVAACVRTMDFARFLPEWIAFHYVMGIDEFSFYDNDSADNTTAVLQPFVDAGIVKLIPMVFAKQNQENIPLNDCLEHYRKRREDEGLDAPTWLVFHDVDEYMFPLDTNVTIAQTFDKYHQNCCVKVPRTLFGSSGYVEMPPRLVLDTFLLHQKFSGHQMHGLPKVMVNLDPTKPEMGLAKKIHTVHDVLGCTLDGKQGCLSTRSTMRINHYMGSKGDFFDVRTNFWPEYNTGSHAPKVKFKKRDGNDVKTDTITHWSCATREVLFRIANGLTL